MVVRDPAPAPAGAAGISDRVPSLQEQLSELESALAAGGSPLHLAKLRAARDFAVQRIARTHLSSGVPLRMADLARERAEARVRDGLLDIECRVEKLSDGAYAVRTAKGRILWSGDARRRACQAASASGVSEVLGDAS